MFYTGTKKRPPRLNIAITISMKHHISCFYNALLEHRLLHQWLACISHIQIKPSLTIGFCHMRWLGMLGG